MDPWRALDDLQELSTEIETALILGADGGVLASTVGDAERSREIGRITRALLATADDVRHRPELAVAQLEIALRAGSVFVVREGERAIVATTGPEPTTGLVLYDLSACLRSLEEDAAEA